MLLVISAFSIGYPLPRTSVLKAVPEFVVDSFRLSKVNLFIIYMLKKKKKDMKGIWVSSRTQETEAKWKRWSLSHPSILPGDSVSNLSFLHIIPVQAQDILTCPSKGPRYTFAMTIPTHVLLQAASYVPGSHYQSWFLTNAGASILS